MFVASALVSGCIATPGPDWPRRDHSHHHHHQCPYEELPNACGDLQRRTVVWEMWRDLASPGRRHSPGGRVGARWRDARRGARDEPRMGLPHPILCCAPCRRSWDAQPDAARGAGMVWRRTSASHDSDSAGLVRSSLPGARSDASEEGEHARPWHRTRPRSRLALGLLSAPPRPP